MGKEKAIVIDIDGVLLDSDPILKEIYNLKLRGDAMWDYFHAHCNGPRVSFLKGIYPLLNSLKGSVYIVLSTSRNECCRADTKARLHTEGFPYDLLYMRKEDDYRPSPEVKKDHLNKVLQKFDIIAFIDDDLANCQMAKEEGIFSLRKV
jgi:hypothetical protein